MKIVLVPIGSAGDVQPLVWLGKILQARGHQVVMAAQESVREMPERAGLTTVTWGNKEEEETILRNPDLWHPRKAIRLITRTVPKWAEELLKILPPLIERGRTVVIASSLAFGARVLSEKWVDVPLLTIHYQPSLFMSAEEPAVMMAGNEWIKGTPRWMRKIFMGMGSWMVDRNLGPALQQVRAQAGITGPPVRGVMKTYWHSPDGVICLFPEWYARKAADWPSQAMLTRFPLYDEAAERGPTSALEAFLAEGRAPLVITPGSANAQAAEFLTQAVDACRRMGRRGVIITRFPEQVPVELPATIRSFEYIPFSEVFPRAAAVIHHGGIGTMAQCFAAGVPQFIMPLAHDQPDNAYRVKKLGVGDYVYPKKFRGTVVAERIGKLLESPGTRKACLDVQHKMRQQMTAQEMGERVEALGERALRMRQM